jgi:hypothetical protein
MLLFRYLCKTKTLQLSVSRERNDDAADEISDDHSHSRREQILSLPQTGHDKPVINKDFLL